MISATSSTLSLSLTQVQKAGCGFHPGPVRRFSGVDVRGGGGVRGGCGEKLPKAFQFYGGLQTNLAVPRHRPIPLIPRLPSLVLIRSFRPPTPFNQPLLLEGHLSLFRTTWAPSETPASRDPFQLFNVMFPPYKCTVASAEVLKRLKSASLGPD